MRNIKQVFEDQHVRHREMLIEMDYKQSGTGKVPLIGYPLKMSRTPPQYRFPPPMLGQHTDELLKEILGFDAQKIEMLRERGVV